MYDFFNDELNEKQRQKLLSLFALMLQAPVSVMREPYVKHFTLERYSSLYELRAKSKTLVRIIFTMTPDGDVLFLTPFVKQHRRDTIVILLFSMAVSASAVENMWDAADRIIKDVYTKIAGISTVLAGLMSAVAVVGAKVSNNQHKTDQAWDWLKRIWLCWIVINGIGAFLAYVQPLFDGLATLDPDGGTSTQ